ncbi:MAG: serine/threonine protein phosphatase [Candidatus Bathyarchaeota archaeon]|nr:serine/threonine protein phosphatase [Candidatus Bathyarchaeum sp.]
MKSHMNTASVLAEESTKISIDEFLRLIRYVCTQLRDEDGKIGTLHITGRLVEVPATGEAIIVGDLHGDLKSLVYILETSHFLYSLKQDKPVLIFLGDYGDRGINSPEVYYVVLKLKAMFPKRVILMRGNHEGPIDLCASPHDLSLHLKNKFGERSSEAYLELRKLFNYLYTAVIIQDRYVLLHGGAPSQAKTINAIAYAHKTHPKTHHLEEILWNDPWTGITGTIASPRGFGKLFGEDITNKLLRMLNVKTLIRGHQSCPNGYNIIHSGQVITLFSRKGKPYNNKHGAYIQLNLSAKQKTPQNLSQLIHKF